MSFEANMLSALFAGISAIAAVVATIAAIRSHKYHQALIKSDRKLLKLDIVVKHLNELMLTFSEIRAISENEASDRRREKLKNCAQKIHHNITIIGSGHPETGNSLDVWYLKKDEFGNDLSQVIDFELVQIGAIIGEKYNDFFNAKSTELKKIQSDLFKKFSV